MAPRPKNPPPDRRQEILDAAILVFAEKGYSAATNAEIAREAGVTAAALYYYFPSKADLFKAAVTARKSVLDLDIEQMAHQMLDMPPEVVLPHAFRALARFFSDRRTQMTLRIILAEGPRNPEVAEIYQTHVIGPMAPTIFKYLTRQMELGRVKQMDPRVLAMQMFGSMIAVVLIRDLLRFDIAQDLTDDTVIQGLTQTLLPGMLTTQNKE